VSVSEIEVGVSSGAAVDAEVGGNTNRARGADLSADLSAAVSGDQEMSDVPQNRDSPQGGTHPNTHSETRVDSKSNRYSTFNANSYSAEGEHTMLGQKVYEVPLPTAQEGTFTQEDSEFIQHYENSAPIGVGSANSKSSVGGNVGDFANANRSKNLVDSDLTRGANAGLSDNRTGSGDVSKFDGRANANSTNTTSGNIPGTSTGGARTVSAFNNRGLNQLGYAGNSLTQNLQQQQQIQQQLYAQQLNQRTLSVSQQSGQQQGPQVTVSTAAAAATMVLQAEDDNQNQQQIPEVQIYPDAQNPYGALDAVDQQGVLSGASTGFNFPYSVDDEDEDPELPECLIWVHDYHLILVPKMIRERRPSANIGFFLHTPFPSSESYRVLKVREELLLGLLSANLVAFHVYDYIRHFLSSVIQLTSLETGPQGVDATSIGGSFVKCATIPIGIEPQQFVQALPTAGVRIQNSNW
jgi:hypothetical protein